MTAAQAFVCWKGHLGHLQPADYRELVRAEGHGGRKRFLGMRLLRGHASASSSGTANQLVCNSPPFMLLDGPMLDTFGHRSK